MSGMAHSYTYRARSAADPATGRVGLETSGGLTTTGRVAHPRFFTGFLAAAEQAATGLLAVANVAQARYYNPQLTALRDPVVTCGGDRLRFESFSGCCGVYARMDVLSGALDGEVIDRGTTNVDVNGALREALARVGGGDPLRLSVGPDQLAVTTLDGPVIEKKVPLPERWLRGFTEVQVITAAFDPRAELPATEAVRFLRSLPRSRGRSGGGVALWAVPAGRSLRLVSRPAPGAVCLPGPERLEALWPLLRFARSLRAYGPVGALLAFEPRVEVDLLAERAGLPADRVRAALAQLGTAGRVGFDVAEAAYFHRELPYDPDRVERMNPRLRNARALVEAGAVRLHDDLATVTLDDHAQQVRFTPDGAASCTCPWWAKYRGSRGPCKHALAAGIARWEARSAIGPSGSVTGGR